jgi:hypothetical protein
MTIAQPPTVPRARTRMPGNRPGTARSSLPTAALAWWRRWRLAIALAVVLLAGGVAVTLLTPQPRLNSYLDPASSTSDGSHALTGILGDRGFDVIRAYSPAQALAAVGSAGTGRPAATLVITSPELLTTAQRTALSRARADLLVVAPGSAALQTLAPEVFVQKNPTSARPPPAQPACGLTAAKLAGSANVAGYAYRISMPAVRCYPVGGYPSLVRYRQSGRAITVLGSGAPLSDGYLARNGNAALALNLLNAHRTIVWLTPQPATARTISRLGHPAGEPGQPGPPLLPERIQLLLYQLCLVVALVIVWRARRIGPLIAERLPVVVRASETVEGHARLYQSRRARGRAATALRSAMIGRVRPALGLAADSSADAVSQALAGRSHLSRAEVAAIVYGPAPATDAELLDLARRLDELEREVRSQ